MSTSELVRVAREIAARDEARLAEIARALVEGDDGRALDLMRAFLRVGEDAEGHRAPARLD